MSTLYDLQEQRTTPLTARKGASVPKAAIYTETRP